MKALSRMIDRFCYKRPRFGIPNLIRYVVFGTALVYIMGVMDTTNTLYSLLAFSPADILRGQVWRLLTFIFVPVRINPLFLLIMLYLSYMLGTSLEQLWGTAKFTIYYLFNIILLALTGMLLHFLPIPAAAVVGVFVNSYYIHIFLLMVFTTLNPDLPFRLMFVIPMRAKWIGVISAGFLLYEMIRFWFLFPINLIPLVLFFVYFLFTWDTWHHYLGLRSAQRSSTVVNFKQAAKKVEQQRQARAYTRKCEVCGKTDTDYPDLEFRYCSRCDGYYCYCMDHINNHEHK